MSVSDEILKRMSDSYRRMRNTARFLLGNLQGFDPARHQVAIDELVALDRWAVARAGRLQGVIMRAYEAYDFHRIYQELHNFCVVDMGSYYLDVIKDRLYTTGSASHPRRSAQTAMYHIAEAMVRWLAPILSFTAEEIWQALPGEREPSVFFATWYELPTVFDDGGVDWRRVQQVRESVTKSLEELRVASEIGSGLDADVTVAANGELFTELDRLGDELRFVFITSDARVAQLCADDEPGEQGFAIRVAASDDAKCVRCWHRRPDVGSVAAHPELCARCVGNIEGAGEVRRFA